jgi:hypothetical protein
MRFYGEIHVTRRAKLNSSGLLDARLAPIDPMFVDIFELGGRLVQRYPLGLGRSLPTRRADLDPPVIQPGTYKNSHTWGLWRGRPTFVQTGVTAPSFRRSARNGTLGPLNTTPRGLHIHSWETLDGKPGTSEGCITCPLSALQAFGPVLSEFRQNWAYMHPRDGEPMFSLVLREGA